MRLQLRSSLVKPAKKVIGKQRLTVLVNVSFPAPYLTKTPISDDRRFCLCAIYFASAPPRSKRRRDLLPWHEKTRKQFGLRFDIQLAVDVAAVDFDGFCRQRQLAGDLFVGEPTEE